MVNIMKNKKILAIIALILAIIYGVYAYLDNTHIKEDKQVITNSFNETVVLQNAIVECYKRTKNLEACNSGTNDIPYPTMDADKGISVYNGVVTVAFISGELSKVLHGGYVELSLDTKTINDARPTWNCTFANVSSEKINMRLLPSLAKCTFRKTD